ncbi:Uncharacterised protein [Klebsiella pneumoniae]|nr:Uncharacterised protein [Klebsiella pneumoniae]
MGLVAGLIGGRCGIQRLAVFGHDLRTRLGDPRSIRRIVAFHLRQFLALQGPDRRLRGLAPGLAPLALVGAIVARRQPAQQQRQADGRADQGNQDHAGGDEDDQVALREGAAIHQAHRYRQHRRQGHRTTHAAQCTEGGETAQGDAAQPGRAFAAPAIDAQRQLPVAIDPAVADQHQHGGDRRHVGQQQRGTPEQVAVVVGHRLHDVRQLQAEQQEHHAVEGELQHRPDAAVEQARGSLPRQQVDPALHHAGRHRRENPGDAQVFRHHVGGERQQQHQYHVGRRVVPATGDHPGADAAQRPAEEHPDGQAADRDQEEVEAGVHQREHAGHRRGDGELECHQARGIVHQRLALQQVHQALGQPPLGDRRDRQGVRGRQHGGEGEGSRQGNFRDQQVDEIAGADHGEEHQAERHHQDRPAHPPDFPLGNTPAVDEQQRRNEQEEEQLRVEGNVQSEGRQGQQGPGGDLDQW